MTAKEANDQQLIKDAIIFYERRGYCWLDVVGYLAAVATGRWPQKHQRRYKRSDRFPT